uniref:Major capsid protein n=1 Tax=viral metagenome TaxID=1070528 RepID=A0A6M3J2U9_9ZZZZ
MAATFATGTAFGNTLTRIGFSGIVHFQRMNKVIFRRLQLVQQDTGDESVLDVDVGLPIRSLEALNSKRAQEVRVGMLNALTNNRSAVTGTRSLDTQTYGSLSTNNMVDYEESAVLRSCTVYVDQSKNAVAFPTKEIQDLRTEFKVTSQGAKLLADWAAQEDEENILDAIYDQYSAHVVAAQGRSTSDPPSANLFYAGSQSSNANLGSGDTLTPTELRRMCDWTQIGNGTSPIAPMRLNGKECFLLLAHPYCFTDLMGNAEFQASYQQGWQRQGAGDKGHPLFHAADAEYAGIYIMKYNRIRAAANLPNVRRCILLGANAVAEGVTSRARLVRRKEDQYEDVLGLGIKSINGWGRFDWAPTSGTTINQSLAIWGIHTRAAT